MSIEKKNWTLYVLKLEDNCYYVGITSNTPEYRFKQHQAKFMGAAWTKKHRPIEIIETTELGFITKKEATNEFLMHAEFVGLSAKTHEKILQYVYSQANRGVSDVV